MPSTAAAPAPLLATLALAIVLSACAQEKPPTEPEGGLTAFIDALASGDPGQIYGRLSDETQSLCADALDVWRRTDEAIDQLQASDQGDARAATGVAALDRLESPEQLFASMTDITAVPPLDDNNRYRTGLRAAETLPVGPETVLVVTRAGQEFEMILGEDGEWRVREPMYSLVQSAVANLHRNYERVQEAVRLFGLGADIDDELRSLGLLD